MLRLEMFFTNIDSLMPGLQNLWRAVRRYLLSEETLPRLLISKAVTVVLMCVISVTKCAYLFDLSVFLWVMFTSRGTVICYPIVYPLLDHIENPEWYITVTFFNNTKWPRQVHWLILDCDPEIWRFEMGIGEKEWKGKRRKYLDKENIMTADEMKKGERKMENIWRRKISFFSEERKNGEENGGKHL